MSRAADEPHFRKVHLAEICELPHKHWDAALWVDKAIEKIGPTLTSSPVLVLSTADGPVPDSTKALSELERAYAN